MKKPVRLGTWNEITLVPVTKVYGSGLMTLLEQFSAALPVSDASVLAAVRHYLDWQNERANNAFVPGADDDVDLRTYLLDLRVNGMSRSILKRRVNALERFYRWMQAEHLIDATPFGAYNFDRAYTPKKKLAPRQDPLPATPLEREVVRLTALNQIAEQLNSSLDVQSAFEAALNIVLQVMGLQTGWISMLAESPVRADTPGSPPGHGFVLVAACGLPPGLAREDCLALRRPPPCHCQRLLVKGKLTRAVNVVECERLRDSARENHDTDGLLFHASLPLLLRGKPLGLLNVATTEWQFLTHADLRFLSAVSTQIVTAIERAHFYDIAETRRVLLEQELSVAHEVQASLVPRVFPVIPGFGFAGAWHPAREVAGDFYDVFPIAEGRWGIVIGDVAGKGAAAVLYMAMARSLILSGALRHHGPADALREANRTILLQYPLVTFVTVFLAVLDSTQHTLTYANAGHNPPIVREESGTLRHLHPTGSAVGITPELPIREETIRIQQGEAIVMYTDGLTEALNASEEFYEDERLNAVVAQAPGNARALLAYIEADLEAFIQGSPQSDDIALLVLDCA